MNYEENVYKNRTSIQSKIGIVLIMLTTVILSLYAGWEYISFRDRMTLELERLGRNVANRLADNLARPVWEVDDEAIKKVVMSEMADKKIHSVLICEDKGTPYKIINREKEKDKTRAISSERGFVKKLCGISINGKKIGYVEVHVSKASLQEQMEKGLLKILLTVLVLDILLFIVLSASLRVMLIRPIKLILDIANAVSAGDFGREIGISQSDEIGELADAFRNMERTIGDVTKEMEIMITSVRDGKLDMRGNPEPFEGGWKNLVAGINSLVDAFTVPFTMSAEYIAKISKGEIPEKIKGEYRGEFNGIKNNLNILIDATNETIRIAEEIAGGNLTAEARERSEGDRLMKALNLMIGSLKDVLGNLNNLAASVRNGKLEVRGDELAFAGGWRELVSGINSLIEAFAGMREAIDEKIHALNLEIAARKAIEKELEKKVGELGYTLKLVQETQHELVQSEKMASLGRLVAGVTHEINTPVGVGVTAASILKDKTGEHIRLLENGRLKKSDLHNYFQIAVRSSDLILFNLSRAVNLINSFKQVAVDQTWDGYRIFNVREYLDDILKSLSPRYKKMRIDITVNCPDDLHVRSYPGVFSQIVGNLVMNSILHGFENMESGEIMFDISREDGLLFVYRDNGNGIADSDIDMIFEPFFTTKRGRGGTGLGMHIVYNLVTQKLNGRIECSGEIGKGVRFDIWIPAKFE